VFDITLMRVCFTASYLPCVEKDTVSSNGATSIITIWCGR